jgi:hypothetical protein
MMCTAAHRAKDHNIGRRVTRWMPCGGCALSSPIMVGLRSLTEATNSTNAPASRPPADRRIPKRGCRTTAQRENRNQRKQSAEPTFADLGYNGITQSRARDADVHADPYQCGDNQERHRINLS